MTVALIDDDEAALDSLRLVIEGHGMTVRSYASVENFLAAIGDGALACIVSDVRLPGLSGLDLQRCLKQKGQTVPLILITGHGDVPTAVTALKDGAFDFFEKPYDAEQLIAAIERASAAGAKVRLRKGQKAEILARIDALPPRQREVMELVAEGLSNKHIAARLGISPRTVENYRSSVMEGLGASSLPDLVRKVLMAQTPESD